MKFSLFVLLIPGLTVVAAPSRPAIADNLEAALIPTGAVYVCVAGGGKDRTTRPIELPENIGAAARNVAGSGRPPRARSTITTAHVSRVASASQTSSRRCAASIEGAMAHTAEKT